MITVALVRAGIFMLRTLKIVDISAAPYPCDPGGRNGGLPGSGSPPLPTCGPGPGGGIGPTSGGGSGEVPSPCSDPGAMYGSDGPSVGGIVRAPGGPGTKDGGGVPWTGGEYSPGNAALGTPGAGGGAAGLAGKPTTAGGP